MVQTLRKSSSIAEADAISKKVILCVKVCHQKVSLHFDSSLQAPTLLHKNH